MTPAQRKAKVVARSDNGLLDDQDSSWCGFVQEAALFYPNMLVVVELVHCFHHVDHVLVLCRI